MNYHLDLSPMFMNCFMLNLTVIYIISIVHMDKIWVRIANKFWEAEVRGSVNSDTPGQGGPKRTNFCNCPFWMAPNPLLCIKVRTLLYTRYHADITNKHCPAALDIIITVYWNRKC